MWIGFLLAIQFLWPGDALAREPDPADADPVPPDAAAQSSKIAQKIKLLDQILNSPEMTQRLEAGDDAVARDLLSRAEENYRRGEAYYLRGKQLEADAVLDYVLRDLSAASRLLSKPQREKNAYRNSVEQLDSLIVSESSDLNQHQRENLRRRLGRVGDLRDRAIRMADDGDYGQAIALLEQAYREKATLINDYQRETTVIYDLELDTVQQQYRYLVERTHHYLELVQSELVQSDIDARTRNLADDYLYRSLVDLETAEDLESRDRHADAIPLLDRSIGYLSAVLKLLGVTL